MKASALANATARVLSGLSDANQCVADGRPLEWVRAKEELNLLAARLRRPQYAGMAGDDIRPERFKVAAGVSTSPPPV
jgi:hypothetical protein